MKPFKASILFLLIFITASSCASKKKYRLLEQAQSEVSLDSIYNNIFKTEHAEWFSGKARITIEEESGSTKALVYIRMKKDSVIWTAFKKLSVEAARSQITPDSFYIIYRQDKKYSITPLDSLSHIYGFQADFGFISDIIAGSIPPIDTSLLWEQKENNDQYSFRSIYKDVVLDFNYDKKTGVLTSGSYYDRFGKTGNWVYSDYRLIYGKALPFQREFHVKFANGDKLGLKLEFLEIETDKEMDIRFNIPTHYEKIED